MKAPIYNEIKKNISKQRTLFTTPGHNGKVILNSKNFCKLDASTNFESDKLDIPRSYILDSEYSLMKMYNTCYSYYITNGTSSAILAMIGSVLNPGDKIIVDRDCHKSVIDAIMLGRLTPVFIKRDYNSSLDFFGGTDLYALESTLSLNSDAKAIYITSPNYYGVMSDIAAISEMAYKNNMLLLVDESHGAHLPFSSEFPPSALNCGADIVVHNTGETLGSMSGGALLHINNNTIDLNRVRQVVYTYQSPETSNAYLCALENSIYYAQAKAKKFSMIKKEIDRCSSIINDGTDIIWFDAKYLDKYWIKNIDTTRIVLNFSKMGMSGAEASAILRQKFDIEPEAALGYNVILVASLFNSTHHIRKLSTALMYIYNQFLKRNIEPMEHAPFNPDKNIDIMLSCIPANTLSTPGDKIDADAVLGRICKTCVYEHPTYIPLIIPGERISESHLDSINSTIEKGGFIGGLTINGEFDTVDLSYSLRV